MDLQYIACKAFYWLYFFQEIYSFKTSIETGNDDDAIGLYL